MPRRRNVVAATAAVAVTAGATALGAAVLLMRRRAPATLEGRSGEPATMASTSSTSSTSSIASTSRAARTAEIARLGSRAGSSYALHRARRLFASVERQQELDAQFELETAEQVVAALGNLKGALMKLGQMASFLNQGLPEQVRNTLATLQQDAPPMSADLAAAVIGRELGQAPDKLFAEWDPRPIASASIGQVHRAITREGEAVAVKVQYPGVDDAIRADLDNAGLLFGAIGMLFPGLEPGPLVAELRARLLEEIDYTIEAGNQRLFADYYEGHPFIHVPAVVDRYSTRRVLTTELAAGARFDELATWSQDERNLAGEAIYRFVFRSLYRLHAFNGDPHPGNYLFHRDGRVTFLDFGLVKRYSHADLAIFIEMIDAMVIRRDVAAFRRVIEDAGLLRPDQEFGNDQVEAYFSHFYAFVLDDRSVTMTPEYAAETVRRFFDASGPNGEVMKAANVPPNFALIQRINLGLYAVLGQLAATANWRRIAEELWPWVDGPPSTELGQQEARWREQTGR